MNCKENWDDKYLKINIPILKWIKDRQIDVQQNIFGNKLLLYIYFATDCCYVMLLW